MSGHGNPNSVCKGPDGREITLGSATDKMVNAVLDGAAEIEREKAHERTREAMVKKAKAGHVTGGRKFGYENVEILGPTGARSHVDRQIRPIEAAVVLRIFRLAAQGWGHKRIAHTLNEEAQPAPRAHQGRRAGWSASTVREILRSGVYRGEIVWGRTAKRDAWGQRQSRATARRRPQDDWIRVERPDLRIVPEPLWLDVQARLRESTRAYLRSTDGRLQGRPLKYPAHSSACNWPFFQVRPPRQSRATSGPTRQVA